jgi:hypothetical protein
VSKKASVLDLPARLEIVCLLAQKAIEGRLTFDRVRRKGNGWKGDNGWGRHHRDSRIGKFKVNPTHDSCDFLSTFPLMTQETDAEDPFAPVPDAREKRDVKAYAGSPKPG